MLRARQWLLIALVVSGCASQFVACDPPRPVEDLPVKLWTCTAYEKRCMVYARFQTVIDCDLFRNFLGSECDPAAPPGELRCRQTKLVAYHREWFHECTTGDRTFEDVRDGGGWIR